MEILRDLIRIIKDKGIIEGLDLRPVDIRIGVFYTGVKLNTAHAGIAYTPIHDLPEAICCPKSHAKMPQAGELLNQDISTLMKFSLEEKSPLKAAIGVATLNALSATLLEDKDCPYKVAGLGNALDLVEINKDDTVGMVGAFPPFIKQLKETCKELHVFEKNPWLAKEVGIELQPEALAKDVLPGCDVLIITGVTIVNHTLGPILESCKGAREVVLVGPTASLYPEPFFRRGVTVMGGVRITDPDQVMKILTEGGSGYDLFEKYADRIIIKRSAIHAKV
ncbi:MAG: Rossmann-like domain-containing protein [Candidatus Brocadiales bacterium]